MISTLFSKLTGQPGKRAGSRSGMGRPSLMNKSRTLGQGAALALAVWVAMPIRAADTKIDFDREIRPILSETCYTCHGPDENTRKAKLRLDTRDGAFAKHEDYQIVKAGDRAASELYRRLITTDEDDHMPPASEDKPLTQVQIEKIGQWIDQGAHWEQHWAFVKPESPAIPRPATEGWAKNEIDEFILARLETEGLRPSPEADKETLVRRASLDLRGLPPTLREVEAFLQDDSPQAYEALVDRFLATPQYGEKMALHWLDLARYADTHGYHLDSGRDMSHWRDWVIESFNGNMPYDQFTVEQIAGDLLPDATPRQKLASGFNRNNMINFEGGAIPEEYLTYYIRDRVTTTSTVFLGLTMACAQCHDHKFDPISQNEFYRFYAYFNAVSERGLDGGRGNAAPLIKLPSGEQQAELDRLQTSLTEAKQRLEQALPGIDQAQADWEKSLARQSRIPWLTLKPLQAKATGGAVLTIQEDLSILAGGPNPENDSFEVLAQIPSGTVTGVRLEALRDDSLPKKGPGRADNSNFVLTDFELASSPVAAPDQERAIPFGNAQTDFAQAGYDVAGAIDEAANTGWAIDAPTRHKDGVAWFIPTEPIQVRAETQLRFRLKFDGKFSKHSLGRFRLSWTTDPNVAVPGAMLPLELSEIIAKVPEERTPDETKTLRNHYRNTVSSEHTRLSAEVARLDGERKALEAKIPTSMVMDQMDQPRDTFVLIRGQYDQHGDKVTPGVPASLSPLPADAPPNRLGLARWLVAPENPLTARVTVNRFWALVMGTGIVKTANDFGTKGEQPTHPALLDWLATDFVRSGWDVKRLMKMMVTSATYRQDTRTDPNLLEKDPYNRLYARGPRFRLSAEEIHDTALSVSGLLVNSIGGPAVFPYQPPGLWEELSSRKDSKNWSAQSYTQSQGSDLYRRGVYTFWKRTSPPPSLQAFDAPDRETCTVQRERTSTPLQALVLLNDPTYVEASRKLAERLMTEAGTDAGERIRFAFRLATSRHPSEREVALLRDLYEGQLERFRRLPESAAQLLSVGESGRDTSLDPAEHAAWTSVSCMILNLDETITKG
jgi:hypothetical protein